jgi:hypothetical protein
MRHSTRSDLGGAAEGKRNLLGFRSSCLITPRTASSFHRSTDWGFLGFRRVKGEPVVPQGIDRPCVGSAGSVIGCRGGGGLLLPTLSLTHRGVTRTNQPKPYGKHHHRLVETSRHLTSSSVKCLQAPNEAAPPPGTRFARASTPGAFRSFVKRTLAIATISLCTGSISEVFALRNCESRTA